MNEKISLDNSSRVSPSAESSAPAGAQRRSASPSNGESKIYVNLADPLHIGECMNDYWKAITWVFSSVWNWILGVFGIRQSNLISDFIQNPGQVIQLKQENPFKFINLFVEDCLKNPKGFFESCQTIRVESYTQESGAKAIADFFVRAGIEIGVKGSISKHLFEILYKKDPSICDVLTESVNEKLQQETTRVQALQKVYSSTFFSLNKVPKDKVD